MTDWNDSDDLSLAPDPEDRNKRVFIELDEKPIPDITYLPITCRFCRIRIYIRESDFGKWTICPDCEGEIYLIPIQPDRTYIQRSSDPSPARFDAVPVPYPQIQIDYRTCQGAVDEGVTPLPYLLRQETDIDPIEDTIDQLVNRPSKTGTARSSKNSETVSTIPPIPQTGTSRSATQNVATAFKTNESDLSKSSERSITPIASPPRIPDRTDRVVERGKQNDETIIRSDMKSVNPWNLQSFFRPVFDPVNRGRLRFTFLLGFVSLFSFFLFCRQLHLFFIGTDRSLTSDFSNVSNALIFYILSILPLAIWFSSLVLTGISIFIQTLDGQYQIRWWKVFRIEFAGFYFRWIYFILFLATMPGPIIYFLNRTFFPDFNGSLFIYSFISAFFLFPPFWLCNVISTDRHGLELFRKRIWNGMLRHFWRTLSFYFYGFLIFTLGISVFFITFLLLVFFCAEKTSFWLLLAVVTGVATLVPFFVLILNISAFRLLGAIGWTLCHSDSE